VSEVATQLTPFDEATERRLLGLLASSPKYSHHGVKEWSVPNGFKWFTETIARKETTYLVRLSDLKRVLDIPRYTTLVHSNTNSLCFTQFNCPSPTIFLVDVNQLTDTQDMKNLSQFRLNLVLNTARLKSIATQLPAIIAQPYRLGNKFYVWSWNSLTSELNHLPVFWFNSAQPDTMIETIESLVHDPESNRLIGTGARIPNFVMSADASRLIGFIRIYEDQLAKEAADRKIRVWTERLQIARTAYLQ